MLRVINECFGERMTEFEPKIKEMIPSYGKKLAEHPELFKEINKQTASALGLKEK